MNDIRELYDLCQEKWHKLKKASLLETHPTRQLQLREELKETEAQCQEFAELLGEACMITSKNKLNQSVNLENSSAEVIVVGNGANITIQRKE